VKCEHGVKRMSLDPNLDMPLECARVSEVAKTYNISIDNIALMCYKRIKELRK